MAKRRTRKLHGFRRHETAKHSPPPSHGGSSSSGSGSSASSAS